MTSRLQTFASTFNVNVEYYHMNNVIAEVFHVIATKISLEFGGNIKEDVLLANIHLSFICSY